MNRTPFRSPHPTRNNQRQGFTLVELLVVIAIVAILGGILVPVIRSAMVKMRESKCASNLRQFQAANMLYATDHKGRYVPVFANDSDGVKTNWYSFEDFRKLLEVPENYNGIELPDELRCPLAVDLGVSRGYGYNCTGLAGSFSAPNSVRGTTQSRVARPAESIAFIDGLDWQVRWDGAGNYPGVENESNLGGGIPSYRHNHHAHVVFWDGHVERVPEETLMSNEAMWLIEE